ncbi:hypothetical protein ABZZ47_43635 [Streptomyces sp. NPDC006465]|uniref:hypothetical protein n=1 Tax=Streptomyces sp. NPDC006465 TaxID=3157174 RepID=UPI0033BF853C
MFPALLQASADPAALPLLPAPTEPSTAPVAATEHDDTSSDEEHPTAPAAFAAPTPAENTGGRNTPQNAAGPEIRVLGPVDVDGVGRTGHGPRTAQLAALL